MDNFIVNSIEYRYWGCNKVIASAIATTLSTLMQEWGLWKEIKMIWQKKSAESLSAILFSCSCFSYLSFVFYGYYKESLAYMFNGLEGFLYIPIIIGIMKYKGFKRSEYIAAGIFSLMIPAMIIFMQKDIVFLFVIFCTVIAFAIQAHEIREKKNTEAISPKTIASFLSASLFLAVFGFVIHNWIVGIVNSVGIIVYIVGLVFCYKYQKVEKIFSKG